MAIIKNIFGSYNGCDVYSYTLTNNNGLEAEILTFGGIIRRLVYKGTDVVLGRDNMDEYFENEGYFGAIIGRNSNRIENAEFCLNDKIIKLNQNDGVNNIHGGNVGFDKKIWSATEIDESEPALVLELVSPDGEEGFPGEVKVKVTYRLTLDNAIVIHYEGISDCDTVLNMTNHSYFNLNGHSSGTVDGHRLSVDSSFYTPNNTQCLPTGEILSVKDTPFELKDTILGECFNSDNEQIRLFNGFDHNFALNGRGYRKAAKLVGEKSNIVMEMYTDQSGVQICSGNGINEKTVCKEGAIYPKRGGICLETQAFPNGLKFSHFPCGIIKKGEKYDTTTAYKFI